MPTPQPFPAALALRAMRLMVGCDRPAAAVPAAPAPSRASITAGSRAGAVSWTNVR